jgi:hypothetical protein
MQRETDIKPLPQETVVDEQQTLMLSSHLLITDLTSKKVILNKRLS